MAVVQISRIQVRRGLAQDLPQLASGEFGWAIDDRKLYIGNGTTAEGAPLIGNTEILTQYSDLLALFDSYTFRGLEGGFEVRTGETVLDKITRTLINKLDDFVNVRDFGAVGRGADSDDTDAVIRALQNLYNNSNYKLVPEQHRTIYFPAGKYRISDEVLEILPWTRIKGDGKACTEIVQISASQPAVIRLVDNLGRTGANVGAAQGTTVILAEQYQLEDIALVHESSVSKPAAIIDGGADVICNRVRFDCGPVVLATLAPTTGHAGVKITGTSLNAEAVNIRFHQCDFVNSSYGAEVNGASTKVSFSGCKFDQLYHGVVAGNDSPPDHKPSGITIEDCKFDNVKAEAIYGHESVQHIKSISNAYGTNVGRGGSKTAAPTTPVLTFNSDYNFSIADQFNRTDAENLVIKPVETNGYTCYAVLAGAGVLNGRSQTMPGLSAILAANQNNTDSGVATSRSVVVDYSLERDTYTRQGTMKVSILNGVVLFDEEYNETGPTNVSFAWEISGSSAILKYTSNDGSDITFFYNLKFFE